MGVFGDPIKGIYGGEIQKVIYDSYSMANSEEIQLIITRYN